MRGFRIPWWLVALADVSAVHASFLLAFHYRLGPTLLERNITPYYQLAPLVMLSTIGLMLVYDLYTDLDRKRPIAVLVACALSGIALSLVTMALSFWVRGFGLPRSVILIGFGLAAVFLAGWRILLGSIERRLRGRMRVLVIGAFEDGPDVLRRLLDRRVGRWLEVARFSGLDRERIVELLPNVDMLVVSENLSGDQKGELLSLAMGHGKGLFLVPGLYEIMISGARLEPLSDMPALEVHRPGLSGTSAFVKRLLDVTLAAVGIALTLPLMVLIAVAIRLTSRGPALYRQERIGLHGKPFTLAKFRTMVTDAERDGPVLSKPGDQRVTPLGRFLRSSRLDELPQLFSVLIGTMSIVGPRPERSFFVKRYTKSVPGYAFRTLVKPGITGLAQVLGRYDTNPADKLRYDLFYIRNYRVWMDLKIMFLTLQVIFDRRSSLGSEEDEDTEDRVRQLLHVDGRQA